MADGHAARKQRTRVALLQAAQALLAEGRTHATILEITTTAGVGFGSFHNHFDSREQLFHEALGLAVDMQRQFTEMLLSAVTDPVERVAKNFRILGRAQRLAPQMARVLLSQGPQVFTTASAMVENARRDLQACIDASRFTTTDLDTAMIIVSGSMFVLAQKLDADPDCAAGAQTDAVIERVLVALGVPSEQAHEFATGPLPELAVLEFAAPEPD